MIVASSIYFREAMIDERRLVISTMQNDKVHENITFPPNLKLFLIPKQTIICILWVGMELFGNVTHPQWASRHFSSGMTKWHWEATKYIKYKTQKNWYNLQNIYTNLCKAFFLLATCLIWICSDERNKQIIFRIVL